VRPGYPVRADRTNCPSARCPCAKARLALGEVSSPLGLHAVVGSTVLELLQFAKSDTLVPSLALPVIDDAVLQFSHDIRDGINEVIQLARTRGYTKRAQLRNALDHDPARDELAAQLYADNPALWASLEPTSEAEAE
jgi:hypothetical protein